MAEALRIAIVGAESTGKSTLAAALAAALAQPGGPRVAWVPELLREWCSRVGRTPQAHEQPGILRAQHERIEAAAEAHDIVVCDTTALMTAVYSRLLFDDRSLDTRAMQLHGRVALTLLTALDLPWVPDGLQRDGPQVREPVDSLLRQLLLAHRVPFAVVGGVAEARTRQAMAAVAPLLRPADGSDTQPGLFTRLEARAGSGGGATRPRRAWACECCLGDYEQALRRG